MTVLLTYVNNVCFCSFSMTSESSIRQVISRVLHHIDDEQEDDDSFTNIINQTPQFPSTTSNELELKKISELEKQFSYYVRAMPTIILLWQRVNTLHSHSEELPVGIS